MLYIFNLSLISCIKVLKTYHFSLKNGFCCFLAIFFSLFDLFYKKNSNFTFLAFWSYLCLKTLQIHCFWLKFVCFGRLLHFSVFWASLCHPLVVFVHFWMISIFFSKKNHLRKKLVKITNYSLINQSNWSKTIFYNTTWVNKRVCVKDMS